MKIKLIVLIIIAAVLAAFSPASQNFRGPNRKSTPKSAPTKNVLPPPLIKSTAIPDFTETPETLEPVQIPEATEIPKVPEILEITETPEIMEILPAQLGQKINCGNKFQFTFYYQPLMSKSNSGQVAKGKFLVARVLITNLTDRTLEGLPARSFRLHGIIDGVDQEYKLHIANSFITSDRWDVGLITDTIQAGGMLDTFLVFDVPGKADNWYLKFEPIAKSSEGPFCRVAIQVPKINYVD
ncbi:MAG TPA: hypothetical protein PKX80_10765 [Flexilinea sp.]|nr:hypothetical protein [Flexilinea sp.]